MGDITTAPAHGLSVDERLTRLEHALAAVALRLTSNYPQRGSSPGNAAAQEITLEYEATLADLERDARRERLASDLAELETVA